MPKLPENFCYWCHKEKPAGRPGLCCSDWCQNEFETAAVIGFSNALILACEDIYCQRPFISKRGTHKSCSAACRQRLSRWKREMKKLNDG